jgi:integrase
VKSLGTANLSVAIKLAAPIIAEFLAIIEQAQKPSEMVWRWIKDPVKPIEVFDPECPGVTQRFEFPTGYVRRLVPSTTPDDAFSPISLDLIKPLSSRPDKSPPALMNLASMSFSAIIELWADERQVPRRRKVATQGIFGKLAAHLAYDDAGPVRPEELVSFKESLVKAIKRGKLTSYTVQTNLETIRTVFRWAHVNKKIASNPADGLTYQAKVNPRKERQDFSPEDMRLILTECRNAKNPVVRIPNLIASFSGARLAEIVEANKADFEWVGEHLVFHIRLDNREEGQTLKNHTTTPRRFPLHSAIRDEIAAHLATLPAGSPLFPKVKVDQDGKRGKNAGYTIMRWLRGIGITDPRKVFHCHRHTVKTVCRGKIDREIRNYITGHANGDQASEYGEYPIEMLAKEIEKIPNPLDCEDIKLAA